MRLAKVIERILATIPIMIGIAVIVFLFMRLMPGDPVDIMMGEGSVASPREIAAIREQLHLDKPIWQQLGIFFSGLVRGDLGHSFFMNRPVTELLLEALPATIELALAALIIALVVAVPVGVISAVRQYSLVDRASMTAAFLGISMPSFWLGIVGILVFSIHLHWLPTSGRLPAFGVEITRITGLYVLDSLAAADWAALKQAVRHLILPACTLGAPMAAIVARVVRSSMLEVLRQDYITLARAKGVPEVGVVARHALRNALVPTVTVVGLQVGVLLGGNMIVETVFSWPGIGRMVVEAIHARDYPLVQGAVMLYAFTFVIMNLVVDILYTYLNPKISL